MNTEPTFHDVRIAVVSHSRALLDTFLCLAIPDSKKRSAAAGALVRYDFVTISNNDSAYRMHFYSMANDDGFLEDLVEQVRSSAVVLLLLDEFAVQDETESESAAHIHELCKASPGVVLAVQFQKASADSHKPTWLKTLRIREIFSFYGDKDIQRAALKSLLSYIISLVDEERISSLARLLD